MAAADESFQKQNDCVLDLHYDERRQTLFLWLLSMIAPVG